MRLSSLSVVAAAVALLSLLACDELIPPVEIPFDGETTLAADPLPGEPTTPLLIPTIEGFSNIELTQTTEFETAGQALEAVESVKLTKLSITASSGDGNFRFLDRIAYFAEGAAGGPGRQKVAELQLTDAQKGQATIEITPLDVDFKPYMEAGAFAITLEASGRLPEAETALRFDGVFTVDFQVPGT